MTALLVGTTSLKKETTTNIHKKSNNKGTKCRQLCPLWFSIFQLAARTLITEVRGQGAICCVPARLQVTSRSLERRHSCIPSRTFKGNAFEWWAPERCFAICRICTYMGIWSCTNSNHKLVSGHLLQRMGASNIFFLAKILSAQGLTYLAGPFCWRAATKVKHVLKWCAFCFAYSSASLHKCTLHCLLKVELWSTGLLTLWSAILLIFRNVVFSMGCMVHLFIRSLFQLK